MTATVTSALCPICRVSKRVRRDGRLSEHTRPHGYKWRTRCEGSGRAAQPSPTLPITEAP